MSQDNIKPSAQLPIQAAVHIRQSGLRSINVERDLGNDSIADSYVLTAQARASLRRILNSFESTTPSRSWTLTGPYGSGKSFFGLFMMNLMGKSQSAHVSVFKQLKSVDELLATSINTALNHGSTQGLLPVPIAGYRAPIQECIKHGLLQSLERLNGDGKIRPLLDELEGWSMQTESRAITRWLKRFLEIITQPEFGFMGMLLIFDEMGKPLEFAANHPEETDIYLLQELAEFANRSGTMPFVFVGILHQAFEQYAHLLDNKTQREWSKVQGRFDDIPFQEPANQQIRLLANAIEYSEPALLNNVDTSLQQAAQDAAQTGWCPPMMKSEEFAGLAIQTYPLHPTALAALPFVFRRLAQNERSIFAYLSSHEPSGFQEFIEQNSVGEFIRLSELFDYLAANFQGRLYATGRARAITETIERLGNLINLSKTEAALLKVIGMLNWLTEVSTLQSTETSILSALRSKTDTDELLRKSLANLQVRSLVVYRRFNKTYSIWQGSDVDIEERLQQAQHQLSGSFSLAEAVQKYMTPRPVAARRHSYQTGTLRYFEVRYIDSFSRGQVDLNPFSGTSGKVLLCLPINHTETEEFLRWAMDVSMCERENVVFGVAERTGRLTELLYELRCLHWVEENTPELRDDPVARRELRTRLTSIESFVQNTIDITLSPYRLSDATGCKWFHLGKEVSAKANQGLSHLLSEICDHLYVDSPILWNEIINRRQLSSQGASARRSLIEDMLTNASLEVLGIEGFPPERSMYDSILNASGLHQKNTAGDWAFSSLPENDPLNLRPVWDEIEKFIFTVTPEPRPVIELYHLLGEPPFGLTSGVLPVILCAFLIINQGETTLYNAGTLIPEPSVANWELLLARPELFQIAGCKVSGTRLAILERFARAYHVEPQAMPVVRSLIRGVKSLPEHTRSTKKLSSRTLAVRAALDQARSPEYLLFADLPAAVEIETFDQHRLVTEQVNIFFGRLNTALTELSNEMPRLLAWGRDQVLTACGLETGDEGWNTFRVLARDLAARSTHPSLLPLLKRASETADAQAALESVLAYIANRPPRAWTDADSDRFAAQAQVLGELFQTERRGFAADASLSAEQRHRSRRVADDLRQQMEQQYGAEPQILKAALQMLAQEYLKKFDT